VKLPQEGEKDEFELLADWTIKSAAERARCCRWIIILP